MPMDWVGCAHSLFDISNLLSKLQILMVIMVVEGERIVPESQERNALPAKNVCACIRSKCMIIKMFRSEYVHHFCIKYF